MPEQPDLILTPFGENAPSGAIDNIPDQRGPSDPPQRASWQDGFPSVTMQPLASGGIPPRGQDFNGVLNAISQHLAYLGAGGVYRWSDEYVAAHGGYSQGAVLQSDDGLSTYISAVDSNTINFNTTPSAIGNQWIPAGGASKANSSLTINAGAGLGGGGNLSSNRTLFVDFASEEQAQELLISNKVISPLNLGLAMNAHVLGMGQTWINMGSQRSVNTTYTNTGTRPIFVAISSYDATGADEVVINGNIVLTVLDGQPNDSAAATTSFIVPPGATYRHSKQTGTFHTWAELR